MAATHPPATGGMHTFIEYLHLGSSYKPLMRVVCRISNANSKPAVQKNCTARCIIDDTGCNLARCIALTSALKHCCDAYGTCRYLELTIPIVDNSFVGLGRPSDVSTHRYGYVACVSTASRCWPVSCVIDLNRCVVLAHTAVTYFFISSVASLYT